MAKSKKAEKRSAPKKAAKRKPHSSEPYLKLADAIMHPAKDQAERVSKKLAASHEAMKKLFEKPDPSERTSYAMEGLKKLPKVKSKLVKMTQPELEAASKTAESKTVAKRGIKFEARYPERIPEKPPEPEPPKIEVTVRSIYYDGQFLPALCFRKPGALHVPCVCGDPINGIRKFTIAAQQHDKSTVLQHGYGNFAAPYSPERFATHMKRIAAAAPVAPEARTMLLPYCPDIPSGPAMPLYPDQEQPSDDGTGAAVRVTRKLNGARKAPAGPSRTDGKELIRALAASAKLPPEKVRAKLRAAGMRAPYTDEAACRKALGVKT